MFKKLFKRADYRRIVLEMGADHPGDIAHLASIAKPHIAVVTAILPVHMANFKDIRGVVSEKGEILKPLTGRDLAVLNYDDRNIRAMAKKTQAQVCWVGEDKKADLVFDSIKLSLDGMSFDLTWKGSTQTINMSS